MATSYSIWLSYSIKKFWLDFFIFARTISGCIFYFCPVVFDWLYWKWALFKIALFFFLTFCIATLISSIRSGTLLWKNKKKSKHVKQQSTWKTRHVEHIKHKISRLIITKQTSLPVSQMWLNSSNIFRTL